MCQKKAIHNKSIAIALPFFNFFSSRGTAGLGIKVIVQKKGK